MASKCISQVNQPPPAFVQANVPVDASRDKWALSAVPDGATPHRGARLRVAEVANLDLERAGAVAEGAHRRAHAFEHGDVKVAERGVFLGGDVTAGIDAPAGSAGQNDWQIAGLVFVAVGEARAEEDHGIVEQGFFAFTD